jgi:hypothetical protein
MALRILACVFLVGAFAVGPAHASDSRCLWRNLSKFSQEQLLGQSEAEAIIGLKSWGPAPGDWEHLQVVCPGAREFPNQAKLALKLIAAEQIIERALDTEHGFNSLNAEVAWETAPLQVRYQFRNWRLAGLTTNKPDDKAIAAAENLLRAAEQGSGKNIEGDTPAMQTLMRYFAIRSMREEAEANF